MSTFIPIRKNAGQIKRTWLATIGLFGAVCSMSASALDIKYNFSNIVDQSQFQTNGSAAFVTPALPAPPTTVLRLTPDQPGQAGSAFVRNPFFVQSTVDFSTDFSFRITSSNPPSLRSDGLAFVVQGNGPGFLGQAGENIGYMGAPTGAGGYFYAVEFDTYANGSKNDPSDNHIAITRTDASGVTTVKKSVDLSALGMPLLDNGEIKNVRIESNFDNINNNLSVYLSEGAGVTPTTRVLNMALPDALFHFGGASTYLGFTGATGDGFANQDILSFAVNIPEPGVLPLVGIGFCALLYWNRKRFPSGPGLCHA